MKKSFNPEDCIGPLNNFKKAMQIAERSITKESFIAAFKNIGLPTHSLFWRMFRESGIIQEVENGLYMFTNKEPIYVGVLQAIKNKMREYKKQFIQKKPLEIKEPKMEETKTAEILLEEKSTALISTQAAINFLKEQGYQILAPIGVVYQQV